MPPAIPLRHRLFGAYLRSPDHAMKLRVERLLGRLLGLREVWLPIPGGSYMRLGMTDFIERTIVRTGCYEIETATLLRKLSRTARCIVDVGSHHGHHALVASTDLPVGGSIIAIEANPVTYAKLLMNVNFNQANAIRCVLGAASDRGGFVSIDPPSPTNTGNCEIKTDHASPGKYFITSFRLDQLLTAMGVQEVDILRMDIEGHEHDALCGLLDRGMYCPRHIIMEYIPRAFPGANKALSLLTTAGYSFFDVRGNPFAAEEEPLEFNVWGRRE